jgi:hypothetical protein
MSPWGYTKELPPDDATLEAGSKQITEAINKVHNQHFKYGPVYTTIYPVCHSCYGIVDVGDSTTEQPLTR